MAALIPGMPADFNLTSSPGFVCLERTMHEPGPRLGKAPSLGSCVSGKEKAEIVCADGSSLESNLPPNIRAALIAGGNADAIIIGVAAFVLLIVG